MNWILNPLPFLSITGNLTCSDFNCPGTFACSSNTCVSGSGGYVKNCGGEGPASEKGFFNCEALGPCNMEYFCQIGVQISY